MFSINATSWTGGPRRSEQVFWRIAVVRWCPERGVCGE